VVGEAVQLVSTALKAQIQLYLSAFSRFKGQVGNINVWIGVFKSIDVHLQCKILDIFKITEKVVCELFVKESWRMTFSPYLWKAALIAKPEYLPSLLWSYSESTST
jgi:hypothetical protein